MIVADTSALVALIDQDDPAHAALRDAFQASPFEWIVPWAVLPEVDYLVSSRFGDDVARAFRADVAEGSFVVEWGSGEDLVRARELDERYRDLSLGLVDTVVMAITERLEARAIVTFDERDFGAVELEGSPALWPRDL